jgi:NADH-quinone oxidoreductase subunit N
MTFADLVALSPLIMLALTAVTAMLVIAFYRNHTLTAAVTLLGLVTALGTLPLTWSTVPHQLPPLLIVDGYALFFMGLILAAAAVVVALSHGYLERHAGRQEEFYILLVLAVLGATVLVASNHFASFFLGLEILSVSLYGLIAYSRTSERSIEAGLKYLVLAAASAAFLVFGMALVYADQGTLALAKMQLSAGTSTGSYSYLLLMGLGLMVVGMGFKLAIVPFHMWTPDVYEGAPAPVTAFVATVSKGAMFALLLRYFSQVDASTYGSLFLILAVFAIASMFVGNLLALLQTNVKRILAYSSIAHLGYLLVAFLASGALAVTAATFYLVAYFLTTLGAFGVVSMLSTPQRDADATDDYRGLFWRRPWLAGIFTVTLFSLAGIPLTVGFVGKFYLLAAGVESSLWLLVISLVISSVIGLYYYLRIIVAMYLQPLARDRTAQTAPFLPLGGGLALATLVLLLVWLGVYPGPAIDVIQMVIGK